MKEFGIAEVREILGKAVNDYVFYRMEKMSDEQLLDVDLRYDFELDSLDFEDMFNTIQKRYGIIVDMYNPLEKNVFNDEETVANLIEMVNCSLRQKA